MEHVCETDPRKAITRRCVIDQIHRFLKRNPTIKKPKISSLCGANVFFEKSLNDYLTINMPAIKPSFTCFETDYNRFKEAKKAVNNYSNIEVYQGDILQANMQSSMDIAWYDMTKTVGAYVDPANGINVLLGAINNCKAKPESLVFWTFSTRGGLRKTRQQLAVNGTSNADCITEYLHRYAGLSFDLYAHKVLELSYSRTTSKEQGAPMILLGYLINNRPLSDVKKDLVKGRLSNLMRAA